MQTTTQRLRVVRALFSYTLAAALVTTACTLLAGEIAASVALGVVALAALLALRARTSSSLLLAAASAAAIGVGLTGGAPSWALAPAIAGGVASAAVAQLLLRHDRAAGATLFALAVGTGAAVGLGGATLAEELTDPPIILRLEGWGKSPLQREAEARVRGAREARDDIAAGRLRLLTYGHPSPVREPYAELLRERLGVELDAVAGCMVDHSIVGRVDGHEAVMTAYLEARHGRGILDALWAEAERAARQAADEEP